MTPLQISILLHYHVSPTDYRDGDFSFTAVRDAINGFKNAGFLRLTDVNDERSSIYQGTDKTSAYVNALCAVPDPVQQWIVPSTDRGGV